MQTASCDFIFGAVRSSAVQDRSGYKRRITADSARRALRGAPPRPLCALLILLVHDGIDDRIDLFSPCDGGLQHLAVHGGQVLKFIDDGNGDARDGPPGYIGSAITIDRLRPVCCDSLLEGVGFEPVWGFSCQVVVFGLLPVLCSERESRSSSRRLAIRLAERAEGVKGPKRQQSLAACRLAALVFRSALTPEHAER